MFKKVLKAAVALSLLCSPNVFADDINDAVNNVNRSIKERSRDEYRHPQQTLRFFDVQPNMTVAEISPGGGWYSNILAPLLSDKGQFYAAHFYIEEGGNAYYKKSLDGFMQKISQNENSRSLITCT